MSEDRPEINAVLEHYEVRTKDRRTYMTNCPFHEDRKPSFSVNTETDLFKCQSCNQGGDSFTLIMLKEDTDFAGALAFVAALGLSAGSAGGSDHGVSGGYYSERSATPKRKGNRPNHGSYVPAWRRS